jgi:phosphatidylserine/phosphatidylglycerophosphate/cardiolipin synthase-like enzyme
LHNQSDLEHSQRGLKVRAIFLLATLIFTTIFSTQTAFAQSISVTFNTPGFEGTKHTTTIEDKVVELIDLAKSGSTILIGMYDHDLMPISEALLRAAKRNVGIHIVYDGSVKKEVKKDDVAVQVLLQAKLDIKFCTSLIFGGSCRGFVNNHNKFMLMSELTDGRKDVVTVTSHNWTSGQLNNSNDLLIFSDDKKLYDNAVNYWHGIHGDDVKVPYVLEGNIANIYTFPNRKYDPVLKLLNRVSCQLPGSTIRVLQSRLTDNRVDIAKRLLELHNQGCDVSVISRWEPSHKSPGKKVTEILGNEIHSILKYEDEGDHNYNSNHSKNVLINASVDNSPVKKAIVLAGSHNLNGNSLNFNDELLAQVEDQNIWQQYFDFWNRVNDEAIAAHMYKNK